MAGRLLAAAVLLLLAGCATPAQHARAFWAGARPAAVELTAVPFHPQREYQCGPAAIATVLGATGLAVAPDELTPEVFVPARRGSLQTELAASARRHGRLAYVLRPGREALLDEVASGRPVLVLQNLGLRLLPRWHYAVVVGYDAVRDVLVLRSGVRERMVVPRSRFSATWHRAGNWAMVVARPGELPVSADAMGYARAIADLEAVTTSVDLAAAYAAGRTRWPGETLFLFGLANQQAAHGHWPAAETLLGELLEREPADVPARNNLAVVLMRMGRLDEAARQAAAALAAAQGSPWQATVMATIEEIRAARAAVEAP